ncbi:MAG TPA: hypothetical protein VJS65_06485 [Verrucomicrobiae bacterium]|nr:hypothetical protein [Verrucomicrobiae bacterium]
MIVVADTSVILNLCCVRREHLLASLFGRVLVPTEVASEFRRLAGADARFVANFFAGVACRHSSINTRSASGLVS